MKKQLVFLGALALGSAAFIVPSEAQAAEWIIKEDAAPKRPWELGILVGLPFGTGGNFQLDPGVLLGIPLVDKGFLPINDSFYLELGAWTNIQFDPSAFGITPVGGVRWNFHLMEIWDAYGAVRSGVYIHDSLVDFSLNFAAGTTWKFSKSVGLRGELGGGIGGGDVSVGIDIDF